MTSPLNQIFMNLATRAERYDPSTLANTFVDVGPLFTLLSSTDHQILYGRRGTGKTHALYYLSEAVRGRGDLAVYVDMRTIGSTGGIHADPTLSIAERGTRLLADTLAAIHDQLVEYVLREADSRELEFSQALAILDSMAEALTEVKVVGTLDREARLTDAQQVGKQAGMGTDLRAIGGRVHGYIRNEQRSSWETETRMLESGVPRHRVHFGAVATILRKLLNALPHSRMWILIDEWSDTPTDLQPLLADFIKRSLFPVRGITVKIGAIEHRSRFSVPTDDGGYLGIELGADASANVDLDDFMVFSNDVTKAEEFFGHLLARHVLLGPYSHVVWKVPSLRHFSTTLSVPLQVALEDSLRNLMEAAFLRHNAFEELVRAAEGLPRDSINILAIAAQLADEGKISVPHVRAAAGRWYRRDKERAVSANPHAQDLLYWMRDEIIGNRRSKAVLLEQEEASAHPLIQSLYDSRVLHVLRRGVATRDRPGIRFDIYALDYGCYVDMPIARAPRCLFEDHDEYGNVELVKTISGGDYRSSRRATLNLRKLERRRREGAQSR